MENQNQAVQMENLAEVVRSTLLEAFKELNPDAQRLPDLKGQDVPEDEQKDIMLETCRLLDAVVRRDWKRIDELQSQFEKRGWYETRDLFTTSDGSAFLPTLVLDRILELFPEYGIASRYTEQFVFSADSIKVPYTTAELPVYAVSEGSEILGSKLAFQSVTVSPKKWGTIASWTTETDEEVRIQYLDRLLRRVAAAFAKKMDTVLLVANGEAANHGKVGLLNQAGIPTYTLGSGKTSFTSATVDDYLSAQTLFPEGVDLNLVGVYAKSIDRYLNLAKDASGAYIFGPAGLTGTAAPATRRKYIGEAVFEPSAVMPGVGTPSQAGKPFAIIGDFSYVLMGVRRAMEATRLSEAIVKASDGSTTINLATQDALAVRFTMRFEIVEPPIKTPFVVIKTSAT